jgi:biopolymer transport protein ExbB
MKKIVLLALALLQALAASSAWAYWNADWTRRAKITIAASEGRAESAGADAVPVLVRLHTGNFQFLDARADGADLRFVAADDKTPLKFHIEKFDGVNELAFVWVLVPRADAAGLADHFWLYYGNDKAAPAGDSKGSYDAAQGLAYHFGEREALPQDATGHANHAAQASGRPATAALIGAGLAFDGKSELTVNMTPSLRPGPAGLTVSMWLKPDALTDAALLRQTDGANALALLVRDGKLVAQGGRLATAPAGTLIVGTWQHVALVVKDGLAVYLNGAEVARVGGATPTLGGQAVFGSGLQGEIDELQIASTARPANWLAFAAASQGPDQKRVLVAAAEGGAAGESGTSYLSVLLAAVTPDGWAVIAVLMVMFVVSSWVMVSKALLVRRTTRENALFMAEFEALMSGVQPGLGAAERAAAEAGTVARFGGSPLYRLYAAAIHELHARFDAYRGSGRELLLNDNALSAIRATLDARLVRELQGLNSRLVVLTVSIAGGPFLGLLGTVVGVMITFAAIAAAGDVNVNAIAPGIAAALVATVAGLSVAIPCLFGYNFLTTRIGELTADLHAFNDELVTRIAENHAA